jgi:hypothetical protein
VADFCKKSATSARLVQQPTGLLNKSIVVIAAPAGGLSTTRKDHAKGQQRAQDSIPSGRGGGPHRPGSGVSAEYLITGKEAGRGSKAIAGGGFPRMLLKTAEELDVRHRRITLALLRALKKEQDPDGG